MDSAPQPPSLHRDAVFRINSNQSVKDPIVQIYKLREITRFNVGNFVVKYECGIKDGENNTATVFLQDHQGLVESHHQGDEQVQLEEGCVVMLKEYSPVQSEGETK